MDHQEEFFEESSDEEVQVVLPAVQVEPLNLQVAEIPIIRSLRHLSRRPLCRSPLLLLLVVRLPSIHHSWVGRPCLRPRPLQGRIRRPS